MKILNFKNPKPLTPFSPEWNYYIGIVDISKEINIKDLEISLLKKEKEILNSYPGIDDGGTGLGTESITSRYPYFSLWQMKQYNLLQIIVNKYLKLFVNSLGYKVDNIYSQCWFNVLRNGEQIQRHFHCTNEYCYLSAHLTVSAKDTHTYYYNPITDEHYAERNEVGKLTFFPSWIEHSTDKINDNQERVTVAMDFFSEVGYNQTIKDTETASHWTKL